MSSTSNLAQYFASNNSNKKDYLDPINYPTTSQAIDAKDDDHFENTSFQLKRTRSMGLLDEFIDPTRKLLEEEQRQKQNIVVGDNNNTDLSQTHSLLDFNDDIDNQFIENIDDDQQNDNEINQSDKEFNNDNNINNDDIENLDSPSPPGTPDLYQPFDDTDIVYEPSRHVDYLSHNWKESDISKSWRYIVLKRKDVANSARLENASWRTWAQAKYHLKTISPESVNWLKDSDVTWLYGPLYKEPNHNYENQDNLPKKKYGSDTESAAVNPSKIIKNKKPIQLKKKILKPILKKRTVGEMLSRSSLMKLPPNSNNIHNHINTVQLPSPPTIEDDFDEISKKVNAQYNNSNNLNIGDGEGIESINSSKRHIHFNDRVEQCIVLNYPDSEIDDFDDEYDNDKISNNTIKNNNNNDNHDNYKNNDYNDNDKQNTNYINNGNKNNDNEYNDNNADDEDSDDEGGFFLNVKSQSSAHLPINHGSSSSSPSSSSSSSIIIDPNTTNTTTNSSSKQPRIKTIEWLPATTLNYGTDSEDEEQQVKFALSHNTNTLRGNNYYYDYNSVFTRDVDNKCNEEDYEIIDDDSNNVDLVDVPDNIVLGSNIDQTNQGYGNDQFINKQHPDLYHQDEIIRHDNLQSDSSVVPQQPKSSGFQFGGDDDSDTSDSDNNDEINETNSTHYIPIQSNNNSNNNNSNNNLNRISSSSSSASLSEIAATGYISPNNHSSNSASLSNFINSGDINELEHQFNNLNSSDDQQGQHYETGNGNGNGNEESELGFTKGLSFKSSLLNSWNKKK
ncbi:hypothetical protein WICMUC_004626 [Wickerhamomyces mucosus]|uniref:Nitrogen regulatory protein areA GATA-like domain-containing protein n=1 Tax=Wickerhamomyces mucosus TaxID=1378264 RepID=A0A9P8PGX9_9ASCO|nr:hypothetical protein WICMUC_004626 [Wickerhamomyces mucosus]